MGRGQLRKSNCNLVAVRLYLMHSTEPVQRPQHPQIRHVVITPGEVEQTKPVADGQRVEVQRVASGVAPVLPLLVHLPAQYRGRRVSRDCGGAHGGERTATEALLPLGSPKAGTGPLGGMNVTDLDAAAQKAKLTLQIRSLLDWLGEGRQLTQTGRIGLADARYLVELLDTGDVVDPEIGGKIFKTKSSEDLANLTWIVEWAKVSRLIRVAGTRLTPVKKNAALADRPLDLVLAMLAAYPKLGKSLFPRSTWRQSVVGDEFVDIGQELLTALLVSIGPCPLAALSDKAYDMLAARYTLGGLTQQQHDFLRRTVAVDIRIATSALHVLGVAVLDAGTDRDRADESAELTDLGRYAIRRLRGMAQPATGSTTSTTSAMAGSTR